MHAGEIVAKTILVRGGKMPLGGLFYETHMIKMLRNNNFVLEIKEEIIEYNAKEGIVTCYVVIIELAKFALSDIKNNWMIIENSHHL